MVDRRKIWVWAAVGAAVAMMGGLAVSRLTSSAVPAGFANANGRIEATEINVAALSGGRIDKITVAEGDNVAQGDVLVQMDVIQMNAQKRQAEAQLRRAEIGVETAGSLLRQAEAQVAAAAASVEQARAVSDAAATRLLRSERLVRNNTISQQTLDDDRAADRQARAGLASAEAAVAAAEAGVGSARSQVVDAEAAVEAARAAIDVVTASINDATLHATRDARVQYRVAQEGEIVAAGARILNLVDLTDVYMTFFLPTSQAGRVQVGSEVRLVMDAAPEFVIPASVSYVADVAQFTPKTVETTEEREKLMFRIRARIEPELLRKYSDYVKTGLPGMAWVRLDPQAEWPAALSNIVE
ncbi:MAG: HlyD family efflux transporter periplasmic adaptor subunit [Paracoccus sp. (in: a-proteobacteria)]|uniref:HlyD family secretion protein n=1 Tax=Paracoccus sp. TaxID=267 RepID=UPI0026DECE90|nr:HlyD family efflux transporter periplasmic adaptor subunit [Paracoccus sp. (in: a-proteobacteria)]MDO5621963.1 HlyD family efflux transporter periplasmic adaptor subunit [Paracoccus sp. (in: a-proteobacteria)]